jgi:asparagine synthase (glutamine-hydrolysing)
MCGIAGMIQLSCTNEICERMLKTMRRRGPDDNGIFMSNECCLLHSRLAVIDPLGGAQPMHYCWQNERYTIVYNGELYNTNELRQLLVVLGHEFKGHSDTEVVLHAYAQWAESCVNRFNGIFSFAIWEHKRRKLFLARDRMGVKPLFYKLHDGGLLFASELKTILAYPTVRAQLDGEGIAELFLIGPGRSPGCGVFKGICELEPGCCGYYFAGKWNWKRYWKLTDREHTENFFDTAAHVKYLVTDAIRRQMISDVPVGTFLSGGLDSSLISSVCAKELAKSGEQLLTFSVDYKNNDTYFEPGKFQPESDASYIRLMQEYIHSKHECTVLCPEDLVGVLEDATIARDLPGMADVDFSLLVFCGKIRNKVKVALSGECADEIFGGYPWYRDPDVRAIDGFPWAQNVDERSSIVIPDKLSGIDPKEYVYSRYAETLKWCDVLPGTDPQERRMKEMMVLNLRWFMQTLLDRKDRMSMYNSLEVRVPFCDYRIAEYLYGVPWEFKDYQGKEKGLLRYAMAEYLPDAVLYRKKSPYPKTYDPRYAQIIRDKFQNMLNDPYAAIFEIAKKSSIEDLIDMDYKWPWYGQLMKAPQTMAYMLQINFWLNYYNVDIVA